MNQAPTRPASLCVQMCLDRKEELLALWVNSFFAAYPLDSTGFVRTSQDPFANPVGHMTREAVEVLYQAVAGAETEAASVREALDSLMRLRGVQDMSPSRAVGSLCLIKPILRREILPALPSGSQELEAYLEMESRVDSLVLMALDLYAAAREKVFRIRIEEVKRSQSQVVRWAKMREPAAGLAPETTNPEG